MCTTATPTPTAEPQARPQEAGKCPACDQAELSYGTGEVGDALSYSYPWTCTNCEATGTEWFELVFSEHIIKTPGTPAPAAA